MAEYYQTPEQEQALARLKCAHCQSLINCDGLARRFSLSLGAATVSIAVETMEVRRD
jgi:hypothetical protein